MRYKTNKEKQTYMRMMHAGLSIKNAWVTSRRSRSEMARKHFEHKPYKNDF